MKGGATLLRRTSGNRPNGWSPEKPPKWSVLQWLLLSRPFSRHSATVNSCWVGELVKGWGCSPCLEDRLLQLVKGLRGPTLVRRTSRQRLLQLVRAAGCNPCRKDAPAKNTGSRVYTFTAKLYLCHSRMLGSRRAPRRRLSNPQRRRYGLVIM